MTGSMSNQFITSRKFSYTIALFVLGSSLVMGINKETKQDSWISFILAMILSVPLLLLYSRICSLYPGKNLSQIITEVFGKVFGFVLNGLTAFYAIYLGALVIRNFSEFISVMNMPETPQIPLMLLIIGTALYMAKSGMPVIGRWSALLLPFMIFTILFTIIFTAENVELANLMPIMGTGLKKTVVGSLSSIAFPFAETVVFMCTFDVLKKGESVYKAYLFGAGIGGILLLSAVLRNITTLGVPMIEISYFPSYITARLVNVGDFLTRIEGIIAINLTLCGIVKIAVCIIAASHGLGEMFSLKNHNDAVVPAGLMMLAICSSVYENILEMYEFIEVYYYFSFPFQIALPLVVWIGCEIKTYGLRRQSAKAGAA